MKAFIVIAATALLSGFAIAGSIISPVEAKKHIGEKDIVVAGFVTQVVENSGNILVNFDGDYPYQKFTGVIPQSKVDEAGGLLFLQTLTGQYVAISGDIRGQGGKPQIVVDGKKQFLVAQR